ncbi:uncharacterized protein LOC128340628 isoform X3 [Hemicordylus capensis]|uniref:uncharacterized protein LOC128340628 isoform X3 n=1 Tax=Hemicordylus capensis TaxID=884348 RepID=UPI002303AD6D|nr:uncharacterized protein LOC128340628 isoform X3 [Hemicordylus capensis]
MNKTEKKASNSKLLSPTKLFKRADGKQKGAGLRMGSKLFQVQHYWIRSNCQWLTSRAPGALCECTKKTCLHCVEISLYCYSCACLQWKRRTPLCHFLPTSLVLSPTKPASGMSKSSVQIDMESICGLTVQELSKVTSHGLFFFFLLINRSADPFMSPFFFFSL